MGKAAWTPPYLIPFPYNGTNLLKQSLEMELCPKLNLAGSQGSRVIERRC